MHLKLLTVAILVIAMFCDNADAWWWRKYKKNKQCGKRGGASPYYFGTTNLGCMMKYGKGKRRAPWRSTIALTHRFIYYKGFYFEFMSNSYAYYSRQRYKGDKCSGKMERSPAGYSELSVECIKGCAKNYRCKFGKYRLIRNNCHKFANRLSAVLCRKGTTCPFWCQGSCNHAKPS
eukprot:XP_011419147.1 PREDICTED: uncharacterized protein LOC105322243 [Crassostrea gigas]